MMDFEKIDFGAHLLFLVEEFDPDMRIDDGNRDMLTRLISMGWVKSYLPDEDSIRRRFAITDAGQAAIVAARQSMEAGERLDARISDTAVKAGDLHKYLDLAMEVVELHGEELSSSAWTRFMLSTVRMAMTLDPEAADRALSERDKRILEKMEEWADTPVPEPEVAEEQDEPSKLQAAIEIIDAVNVAIEFVKVMAKPADHSDFEKDLKAIMRRQMELMPRAIEAGLLLSSVELKLDPCALEKIDG